MARASGPARKKAATRTAARKKTAPKKAAKKRPAPKKQPVPVQGTIELDQSALDAFDDLEELKVRIADLHQLEQSAKAIRDELAAMFGRARIGIGPGGRRILHLIEEQHWKALPARQVQRHLFHDVSE